ncbi:unnamed protein product [Mytilus edulis]|uniref:Reverse transcriptase domain-containing protein n=1 Tax=Mytilus edulis TaxID=6550 RepID=A0A8S3PQ34_MYTED|nr:unnamed protein product [Mytilus edulis]
MSESDNESVFTDDFLLYNQITDDIEPDIGYLLQPPASPLQLNTSFSLPNVETPITPAWTQFDKFQTSDFTNSSTPNTVVSSTLDDEVQPPISNFKHNSFHKMEKLANCRKFGGYPHENAFQFLSEFESYAVLHHILPEEDARKIAAFHLHLCGPALTWFNTLPADNKQLWQTFEQVYKKQYIDIDFRSPTILLEGHHSDSANCLAAAKMGEAYGYRKDEAPLVAAVTKSANNTPAAVKDLNNFKTDVVSELQGQINSLTQAVSKLATNFSQQLDNSRDVKENDRFSRPRNRDRQVYQYDRGLCRKCQAPGHFARACNWNEQESTECTSDDDSTFVCKFLYMPVRIANQEISALIDTGSSINVMSSQLFNSIPDSMKSEFSATSDKITLANNQTVQIYGTAKVKITVPQGKHWIHVYILAQTSHPLILGTHYLYSKNIVLDFSDCCIKSKQFKVLTQSPASLPPNSEVLIWGHVNGKVQYGMQGICTSKISKDRGVIISKAVVTVNREKQVPIKILNFTNETVHLNKGQILAELEPFSKDHVCMPLSENNDTHFVQNIQLSTEPVNKDTEIDSKFISYFNIPEYLTEVQKSTLIEFLHSNKELFVTEENPDLGFTNVVQHQICLKPDFKPKHQRSYRLTPEKKDILRHHLDELLRQGVIAPVDETEDVPITSPVVLVSKRTYQKGKANASSKETSLSKFRFCCDFRYLNSMTQHFSYSIPDLQDLTESFSTKTPNFLTSIDLSSGFFQLPISKDSQRYTAFNTCFGTFKFLRLPMGLSSSPASFQLLMDKVLKGLTFKSCLCYLDDILIASETFDQHIEDLRNVFQRLSNAGLKLGPKKCTFAQNSCIYLGHKISNKGIEPPPDRVQAIVDYPIPKNVKELRRLVGLFNWFRKYIKNFSAEMEPLTRLLKKYERFSWTDEQQRAFQNVKSLLLDSPILAFPNFNLPFRLAVDSCCKGIGYVLYQKMSETDEIRVIRFGSKALSKWQKSYGPTKLELLGMVTAVLECSSYLRTQPFVIECDHQALKPLFSNQLKGAIYERWIAILQQYNFEIQYKPAREMQVPDALSRCTQETNNAFESPDEQDPYFPYEPENTGQIIVPGGIQLTTLLHDSDTSDSKNLQLNNICLPAPVPMYTVDNSVPRKNVLLQAQNEYDADTEDIDQQFARVAKKRKPRKTIQLYPRKKYNVVKKSEPLNKLTDCDSKHTQISISDQLNQFEKVYQQITQSTNLPKSDQIFDQSTDSATSQCDATFFNQSTESSQNEEPDKIFNQSTASDNVQDSDKIFEQTTDVNETQVTYISENEITNNYTNKRDSDTGIDSDPNVNILKSIDIFREKDLV